MPLKITYFVHGTTADNEQDLATGWLPGQLSPSGKKQAEELARFVATKHFDAVFCSDLERAVESARLVFGEEYEIMPDTRLRECNYGDYTGRQTGDLTDRMEQFIDRPFPHGESFRDVERRIADFLVFLKKNYGGGHVAIVAHQATQLALDVLTKDRKWEQAIAEDWRKREAWQPGWDYELE